MPGVNLAAPPGSIVTPPTLTTFPALVLLYKVALPLASSTILIPEGDSTTLPYWSRPKVLSATKYEHGLALKISAGRGLFQAQFQIFLRTSKIRFQKVRVGLSNCS